MEHGRSERAAKLRSDFAASLILLRRFNEAEQLLLDARPVLSEAISDGILSVHWSPFFGKFMALSSRPIDAQIAIRLADHPEGPWQAAGIIDVDTLHSGPGWYWTYAGVGHPELARASGRTGYMTYTRNMGNLREIRLMEIRFAKK